MTLELDALMHEHLALLGCYAQAQSTATQAVHEYQTKVQSLERQLLMLRAKLIQRDTALLWEREARMALAAKLKWQTRSIPQPAPVAESPFEHASTDMPVDADASAQLESTLQDADLVICQTACIGHGAYWRVEEHCRRTGTPCMLVEQPMGVRIVRIHAMDEAVEASSDGLSAPLTTRGKL